MGFKNHVCVVCAQDFTRKYSANRHNRLLHQGESNIVRTLEYIIGRVTGEYASANPIEFRKKKTRRTTDGKFGNFPFVNVAHTRSDSQSSENMKSDDYKLKQSPHNESTRIQPPEQFGNQTLSKLEEIKSLCGRVLAPQFRDIVLKMILLDVIEHNGKESVLEKYLEPLREAACTLVGLRDLENWDREKPQLSSHPQLGDLPTMARNKLVEIEQVMIPNNHPNLVWEEIERLAGEYRRRGDLNILSAALDRYKRRV